MKFFYREWEENERKLCGSLMRGLSEFNFNETWINSWIIRISKDSQQNVYEMDFKINLSEDKKIIRQEAIKAQKV